LVSVRPDFVLVIVVIWAVLRGVRESIPWGFVGGLILDLFSGGPFGTASLALVMVAFCSSAGQVSVFRSNVLLPTVTVFWASVLYGVIYLFLLTPHFQVEWLSTMRHIVLPNAVLNTVISPLLYWPISRLERRTRSTVAVDW
jgi:rod shape-determining protein MreD